MAESKKSTSTSASAPKVTKRKATKEKSAPKMPEALGSGNLPAAEFLRQAAIFLAQSGVLAADREDLKQRMREVRRTLG